MVIKSRITWGYGESQEKKAEPVEEERPIIGVLFIRAGEAFVGGSEGFERGLGRMWLCGGS